MTDILTLAKENGFSHIGFADMSALTPLEAVLLHDMRKMHLSR